MKVYNVTTMDKCDYDFSVDLTNEGCYLNKEDAVNRLKECAKIFKEDYQEEIEDYSDEEEYPDEESGALYMEEDDDYFEISFGYEENHECHQVWIDELEVQ